MPETATPTVDTEALDASLSQVPDSIPEPATEDDGVVYGIRFYTKSGYSITIPITGDIEQVPSDQVIFDQLRLNERLAFTGVRGGILSAEVVAHFIVTMGASEPISVVREDTFYPIMRTLTAPSTDAGQIEAVPDLLKLSGPTDLDGDLYPGSTSKPG